MINLNELWIGDKVKMIKSNSIGIFEGIVNDKAKIRLDKISHLVSPLELEHYIEQVSMPEISFENEPPLNKVVKSLKTKVKTEIDLHIEKLNPNFKATIAESVLDYQLKACEDFIREAIDRRLYKCTIIHGKGEGKLRELVHTLLSSYVEVKMQILTNRDGATEVWLAY